MPLLKLVFLGTGGAVPTLERMLPAIYMEDWLGHRILLDAGEGAQYRLLEAGVSPASLNYIAITHGHEDHVLGLPGLVITAQFLGGRPRLLAPRSMHRALARLGAEVLDQLKAERMSARCVPACHTVEACAWLFEWDVGFRLDLSKVSGMPPRLLSRLIRGEAVEWQGRVVRPEEVALPGHRRYKRLLYTGDTAPCPRMWSEAGQVDVLIHEATFADDVEQAKAHEEGHSTVADAVEAARAMDAKVLVLTHISARYKDKSRHRALAKQMFPRSYVPDDMEALLILL